MVARTVRRLVLEVLVSNGMIAARSSPIKKVLFSRLVL